MVEGAQPLLARVELKGDVLDADVPAVGGIRGIEALGVDVLGQLEQHQVVMLVVDAHEADRPEGFGLPPVAGELQADDLPVELERALDYFTRAIAIQPDFAHAHAAIAEVYAPLGTGGRIPPTEAARRMRAAASRALEIDPDLVEALTALGACAAFHEWNWDEGERYFLRALEVNPNYVVTHMWYGLWLEQQGRQPENLRERRRAFELDPLNGPLPVHPSVFGDAVEAIGAAAAAARRRLGVVGAVSPWQLVAAVTSGRLLAAGLTTVSINTSRPLGGAV